MKNVIMIVYHSVPRGGFDGVQCWTGEDGLSHPEGTHCQNLQSLELLVKIQAIEAMPIICKMLVLLRDLEVIHF